LTTSYEHRDLRRKVVFRLLEFDSSPLYANGRVYFERELESHQSWHICVRFILVEDDHIRDPQGGCSRHPRGRSESECVTSIRRCHGGYRT
jgi:hypothetical protein